MKQSKVIVGWKEGLHARPSAKLARVAQKFASTIKLECNGQVANARSFLNILLLCATMGATVLIEAQGEDEERAVEALEQVFSAGD